MNGLLRFKYAILAIAVFVIFNDIIPIKIFKYAPVIISIIGATLICILITRFMSDLNKTKKQNRKFKPTLIAILFIFLSMYFILNVHSREEKELAKDGIITSAIVKGRLTKNQRIRFHKRTSYFLRLKYNNGVTDYETDELVTLDEYSKYQKGDRVRIIYSEHDPTIIEIK